MARRCILANNAIRVAYSEPCDIVAYGGFALTCSIPNYLLHFIYFATRTYVYNYYRYKNEK